MIIIYRLIAEYVSWLFRQEFYAWKRKLTGR